MGGQIFGNASGNNSLEFDIHKSGDDVTTENTPSVETTTTNKETNLAIPPQNSTPGVETTTTNKETNLAIPSQESLPSVGMTTASIIALLALPILFLLALIKRVVGRKKEKHRAIASTKRSLVTVIDKLHGNKKELKILQLSLEKTLEGKTFHPYNLRFQDITIDWKVIKTTEKIYLLRDSINLFHSVEQIHKTFKSVKEVYENSILKSISQYPSATTQAKIKSLIINIQTHIDSAHVILLRSRDMLETTHVLEKKDSLFRFASRVTQWNSKDKNGEF